MLEWPATLPYRPSRQTFRRELLRTAVSTEVEDGPPIRRLQSQTAIKKMTYSLIMTYAQKAIFEDFVENDLNHGLDYFLMNVPLVDGTFVQRVCYLDGGLWADQEEGYDIIVVSFVLGVFTAPLA